MTLLLVFLNFTYKLQALHAFFLYYYYCYKYLILKMENKKLKLPQHLQMDTVSPATRLLEKRRQMYDVQETFEQ